MIVDICTPYKGCRYPQSRRQEHAWSGFAFWGGSRRGWSVEYRARHERVWPDRGFKRVGEIFHVD